VYARTSHGVSDEISCATILDIIIIFLVPPIINYIHGEERRVRAN
jgi:hypothetical protein